MGEEENSEENSEKRRVFEPLNLVDFKWWDHLKHTLGVNIEELGFLDIHIFPIKILNRL